MRVTLTVAHYITDMELKETTSCSQAGILEGEGEHEPTYKIFDQKLVLPTRCTGIKMEQRLKE